LIRGHTVSLQEGLAAARASLLAIPMAEPETEPHSTTVLGAAALLDILGDCSFGATVLDVGAGTGTLAALARRAGARRAVGIEHESALVEAGRNLYPEIELVLGDATAGLPSGRFDIVIANLPGPLLERLVRELVATARQAVVVTGVRLVQGPWLRRALERAGLRDVRASAHNGWCAYRGLI
jgi:ribosomal protein L11 methylase PrmA